MSTLSEVISDQQHRISALEEQNRLLREALQKVVDADTARRSLGCRDNDHAANLLSIFAVDSARVVLATKPTT